MAFDECLFQVILTRTYQSQIVSRIYSDILSGILCGILSDILSAHGTPALAGQGPLPSLRLRRGWEEAKEEEEDEVEKKVKYSDQNLRSLI